MDSREVYLKCVAQAGLVIGGLTTEDYHKPTPDADWDARALANHMMSELSWAPEMVSGKTIAEVGDKYDGDLLGDNPAGSWLAAAATAKDAVMTCDLSTIAHLSFADVPNSDYLRMTGGDLLIHGWDLAVALGTDYTVDPVIADSIYEGLLPEKESLQKSGLFAAPVAIDETADTFAKILALTGRNPAWRPPEKN